MKSPESRDPAYEEPPEDPVATASMTYFKIPSPYPWQRLVVAGVLDALMPPEEMEPLRRIAVLPTGAGKSLCWMLPAIMTEALTIAVFPLLSLMRDQQRRLEETGTSCEVLKGGLSKEEKTKIWNRLENQDSRIILANPEILQSPPVAEKIGRLKPRFLVVDETHTVSQWGESFRPACASLGTLVKQWEPPAVLALTATAGPVLRSRITELLFNGEAPSEAIATADRPEIRYGCLPSLSRFRRLEELVRREPRPMVIFGSSRSSVEEAARLLRHRLGDPEIRYYHAGLSPEEKNALEDWFMNSSDGILSATCAYGMGVDKKNIRTVVHLSPPSSVEAYLQESGRASRDGTGANAWLIWTPEDELDPGDHHRGSPKKPGVSQSGEAARNGVSDSLTPSPNAGVAKNRRAAMIRYAAANHCRREILLEALGTEAQDCSGCDVCSREAWTEPPEREIILKVVQWNRKQFGKGQLARILTGRRTAEIRQTGLDLVRGFGMLAGWELEDVEEAIDRLLRMGILCGTKLRPNKSLPPGRENR